MVVFPGAKINIGLYVTDRRNDGYHNIQTLFYPLGFSDILEVIPNGESEPGCIDLTLSGLKVDGDTDTNLVVRAYRILQEREGLPGVKVFLHKCIPTGAGLGGGSSDGAAMLLILNKIFELNFSYCDLFKMALELGSDCPFFLDPIPSFAHGRGEILSEAGVSLRGLTILLFHPGIGIPTGAAYGAVKVGQPVAPIEDIVKLPVAGWKSVINNAFEPYAFEQQPVIGYIKEELYRLGAIFASMTGSGSAVYGLFGQEVEVPEGILKYLIWKEKI